ncbi:MAG: hypothetical protein DMD67_07555, partial [Gemmatimonadetes bacterium]
LARLVASSQSRKARSAHLAPADQQLFTRDSTARAQATARQRATLAAALQQLAADSTALTTTFAPAIQSLNDYLAVYPGDVDAATSLAILYAQSGHAAQAAAVFDSLAAHAKDLDAEALLGPGMRLVGQGMYRPGARALALGLAKNPYRRDALFSLAAAYYQLRDSASLLPTAQRLLALDPLGRPSLRFMAAGWDFRGARDSVASVVAANLKAGSSRPFRITLEFLDAAGQPVASYTQDIPAIPPRQSQAFDVKVSGRGIAGWRYRAS